MSYQNVGTPRFYVSILQFLKSIGALRVELVEPTYLDHFKYVSGKPFEEKDLSNFIDIDPSNQIYFNGFDEGTKLSIKFMPYHKWHFYRTKKQFSAFLGHNFMNANITIGIESDFEAAFGIQHEVVNSNVAFTADLPDYISQTVTMASDGFSITTSDYDDIANDEGGGSYNLFFDNMRIDDNTGKTKTFILGSFLQGSYYDLPHSPELNITMTRELDGISKSRTDSGSDLTNISYLRPTDWGDLAAWEIGGSHAARENQNLTRIGRRIWDLSFSYFDSKDLMGINQSLSNIYDVESGYDTGVLEGISSFDTRVTLHDSFFSQVIYKTNGGQLPFIFQPDNSNNNSDQFAICKLDMDTFSFEQVAKGLYNIKLKIREVW